MVRSVMVAVLLMAGQCANASLTVSQWYFGSWNCRIDGRPARMVWRVVDDPQTNVLGRDLQHDFGRQGGRAFQR